MRWRPLYLAGLDGEFCLAAANNENVGKIREPSVFIKENGQLGTNPELDLVV